jgi:glutathione synthase/RimK-type ligase-like ATP-grasp enzyme
VTLRWTSGGEHELRCAGHTHPLSEFPSVWYRRPVGPRPPAGRPGPSEWVARESEEALAGLWRSHRALWVNHPDDNRRAEFKQEQLLRARGLGLEVPETMVTNSGEDARAFASSLSGGVICKPLRLGRLMHEGEEKLFLTSRVGPDQLERFPESGETYLLQGLIDKRDDIRVTVIGQRCFAVAIDSQDDPDSVVDWRQGGTNLDHAVHRLPEEISQLCLELCRSYDLQFGAIDLALRPDGGYTFFEVNPNGQWAWIEQLTGLPLSDALADLLLSPC